jgi:hypothetical protein
MKECDVFMEKGGGGRTAACKYDISFWKNSKDLTSNTVSSLKETTSKISKPPNTKQMFMYILLHKSIIIVIIIIII